MKPLVSIAVITYNHERFIRAAIESVLNQTYDNLQVVVVDDGSTDQTPDLLAAIKDARLTVLRQANRGPASAANRSLAHCTGQYAAIFSGDDVLRSPSASNDSWKSTCKGRPGSFFRTLPSLTTRAIR